MEELSRPAPDRSLVERARAWIDWFGPARIVGTTVAVVVVCLGSYWLVRSPPPPSEAALPRAPAASAAAPATLVPPSPSTVAAAQVAASTRVLVHVAGSVARPGVYELPGDARVTTAIDAAGGATPDADPDALNLAAPLADGSRIYVPALGEDVPPEPVVSGPASADVTAGVPLDVNRASADELDALPGIGPSTAAAIVTERDRNGPFLVVDDLERVPGIGPAKLDAIRELVAT